MWTGQCTADTQKGVQCSKRSLEAYWVHSFQGTKFDGPTWVEVCETHAVDAILGGMISAQDIRHFTKHYGPKD